jgi:geranylgeranyl diphosphate synthase, type II
MDFSLELKDKQNIINSRILELIDVDGAPSGIVEAMKYSITAGGKRIRPVLSLSICKGLGGNYEDVLNLACALELIHTYSLIHDDLPAMDNDDLRRGKLTNHKVFGEAKAILAGDGLLNYAYEIIFNEIIKYKFDGNYVYAGEIIARAAGIKGMIGGQVIDIENEGSNIKINMLYDMHRKKTGAIIEASCAIGCFISNEIEKMDVVNEYSKNLGIAFQIIDDILDCTGNTEVLGKNVGSDLANNKATFVSILGINKSIELAKAYTEKSKHFANLIDKTGFLLYLTDYLLNRRS